MEHILIVGAGSVGGFFGAHLAKRNQGVSFLLRPRTLQAVRERGLTVRSPAGTFTVYPPAASDPRELPTPDLIILAMKAYDLDDAVDQVEPVLTDRTVLLTLQNGVEVEDRLLSRLKRDCVVGGVAYIYARIAEPGVIEHFQKGAVSVGELMGSATRGITSVKSADAGESVSRPGLRSSRLDQIVGLFTQAEIPCQVSHDIRRTKWEKMCWNCVFNPLTVILNDRVSRALDHPELHGVIRQIVEEVAAVAAGVKVPLAEDMAERVLRWSQEIRDIHTSMYDDWKAGRPTEIDSLNGYVVRRARELSIPVPVNEALTAIIKVLTERGKS